VFNLVCDPAFLVVAWNRVRGNKGARTAGIDGVKPRSIVFGAGELLAQVRDDLKTGRFVPQRVSLASFKGPGFRQSDGTGAWVAVVAL
jgi:retron-type reverse transcriptase